MQIIWHWSKIGKKLYLALIHKFSFNFPLKLPPFSMQSCPSRPILARIAVAIKSWAVVAPNTFHQQVETIIGQPAVTVHQPRLGSLRGASTPRHSYQLICSFIQYLDSHSVQKFIQFTNSSQLKSTCSISNILSLFYITVWSCLLYTHHNFHAFLQVTPQLTNLTP